MEQSNKTKQNAQMPTICISQNSDGGKHMEIMPFAHLREEKLNK